MSHYYATWFMFRSSLQLCCRIILCHFMLYALFKIPFHLSFHFVSFLCFVSNDTFKFIPLINFLILSSIYCSFNLVFLLLALNNHSHTNTFWFCSRCFCTSTSLTIDLVACLSFLSIFHCLIAYNFIVSGQS